MPFTSKLNDEMDSVFNKKCRNLIPFIFTFNSKIYQSFSNGEYNIKYHFNIFKITGNNKIYETKFFFKENDTLFDYKDVLSGNSNLSGFEASIFDPTKSTCYDTLIFSGKYKIIDETKIGNNITGFSLNTKKLTWTNTKNEPFITFNNPTNVDSNLPNLFILSIKKNNKTFLLVVQKLKNVNMDVISIANELLISNENNPSYGISIK